MDLKIAVLPGDGIGPEIIEQAIKAIDATCKKYGHTVGYTYGSVGATAIDKTGNPYPEETHRICMQSDAVLFGAIGDPRFDNNPQAKVRPEQGLLEMRKKLGLYANLRPVSTFKSLVHRSPLRQELVEGADFICIRELTGGIYFGQPQGRSEDGQTAFDSCVYTKAEIKRICRLGFEYAMKRRNKLTVVDKANVLATSRLWRETVQEMAPAYPQVNVEYMFVDNAAMKLIQQPKHFDVIVTENMFGDILSDEASMITGSIGMIPSSSLGKSTNGMYEPIHGSAPDIAGQNIANPVGTILSGAMMLKYSFDMDRESEAIERAVMEVLDEGYRTVDILQPGMKRVSCSEMGDLVAARIR